jgi:asparagine synthetase B (glutamine-hydrolysing)
MCSLIFSRTKTKRSRAVIEVAEKFLKYRGPDSNGSLEFNDQFGYSCLFAHYLLDISGLGKQQPFFSPDNPNLILLFNGEIYNYQSLSSLDCDTEAVLSCFTQNRDSAGSLLNGEFSVCIYDKLKNSLDIFVDPFLTKPIWIGRSDDPAEFGVASYKSALLGLGFKQISVAQPNTHYRIVFSERAISITEKFPTFDFPTTQSNRSFSQWTEAFVESVRNRATHGTHTPVVYLSSGYDSGAIVQALNLLELPYHTLSVLAGEDKSVLAARVQRNSKHCLSHTELPGLTRSSLKEIAGLIKSRVEPYTYFHDDFPHGSLDLSGDQGALGAYALSDFASKRGFKVALSGAGSDEIISDYGILGEKIYSHSEFGGLFPDDLNSPFFPWKKFYGDTQRSYLFKEELILGCHGMEGRYPFLDRDVVKAFLDLDVNLKNLEYKAPIANFLRENNYPFESGKKRGFSPRGDPILRQLRKRLSNGLFQR